MTYSLSPFLPHVIMVSKLKCSSLAEAALRRSWADSPSGDPTFKETGQAFSEVESVISEAGNHNSGDCDLAAY